MALRGDICYGRSTYFLRHSTYSGILSSFRGSKIYLIIYVFIITNELRYAIIQWHNKYKLHSKQKDMFSPFYPVPVLVPPVLAR